MQKCKQISIYVLKGKKKSRGSSIFLFLAHIQKPDSSGILEYLAIRDLNFLKSPVESLHAGYLLGGGVLLFVRR